MPRTTSKSFHCPCFEKLEKNEKVSVRMTVTAILRTKEGWDMKRSIGFGGGLNFCPICGRVLSEKNAPGKEGKR